MKAGYYFMRKIGLIGIILALGISLTVCGPKTCAECDDEVYKDGLCQYHYELEQFRNEVDDAAKDIYDSIFGERGETE